MRTIKLLSCDRALLDSMRTAVSDAEELVWAGDGSEAHGDGAAKAELLLVDLSTEDRVLREDIDAASFIATISDPLCDADTIAELNGRISYHFVKPISPENLIRKVLRIVEGEGEITALEWQTRQIEACLSALSVPSHLLGHRYALQAVRLIAENETNTHIGMMHTVYPTIAENCGTSAVMVDRAIRHAIDVSWKKGNIRVQRIYFGYCAYDKKGIPTNSEFLFAIAEQLKLMFANSQPDRAFKQRIGELEQELGSGEKVLG
ncbi:MAG: sporulation initiation factor Spo0A C-terminal domain-containing protein [Clostridia bacterium]|nr:sporulation initiation factor Spo0A C-terminal domain-containing protein [Clostridia bacterium]